MSTDQSHSTALHEWRRGCIVLAGIALLLASPLLFIIVSNNIWVTVVSSNQPDKRVAGASRGYTIHQPLSHGQGFRIHLFAFLVSIHLEVGDELRGTVEHRWLCGDRAVFLSFESAQDGGDGHPTKILYDFEDGVLVTACLQNYLCTEPGGFVSNPSKKETDIEAKRKQIEAGCATQPGK